MTVAFLGAGLIASGMVTRLLAHGTAVRVWNRSPEKCAPLVALGAVACATAAEAVAGAGRVHVVLRDDAAVQAVLDPLLPVLRGVLVLDHSTCGVQTTAVRATAYHAAGVGYLHAPVFMSPAACVAGEGFMLLSGPPTWVAQALPCVASMTGRVLSLGERPERAAATKLFGNAMILALAGGLADVLAMARAQGVDPVDAWSIFLDFHPTIGAGTRGERMARGDYATQWTLDMARKDLGLMLDAADGEALAALPGIGARMDALIAAGFGDLDVGVLARGDDPTDPRGS